MAPRYWRWWRGVVGNTFRLKRSYYTPGPVSTAMGDYWTRTAIGFRASRELCSNYLLYPLSFSTLDIKQHKSQFKKFKHHHYTMSEELCWLCNGKVWIFKIVICAVLYLQPRCHLYTVHKLNSFLHKFCVYGRRVFAYFLSSWTGQLCRAPSIPVSRYRCHLYYFL